MLEDTADRPLTLMEIARTIRAIANQEAEMEATPLVVHIIDTLTWVSLSDIQAAMVCCGDSRLNTYSWHDGENS